ncbi:MAG: DUF819 family protein [Bacteroidetes bacterium]|nr:DUF819 family protein [Bacteroidota bacterium]
MKIQFGILIIMFVLAPVIIIYLEGKYKVVKKIGAVLICYALGLIVGNIGILPEGSFKYQDMLNTISIPLALPLILFSLDVRKWFKVAGKAVTSLLIGLFTVLVMVFLGYWIFNGSIDNIWQVSGMLVGVYTGGTPNMAAITTALNASQELFILTNTYEIAFGAVYLIFILSIGQRVLLWILPPFKSPEKVQIVVGKLNLEDEYESYDGILKKNVLLPLLGAFGISIAISGVSYGLSMFFPEEYSMAAIILFITSFGITLSFVPRIKNIKKTFQLGMYFILIFCLAASSTADISKLTNISISLFYYVGLAMFGSHILHVFIARIFKIDADTVIISGAALICSPPFVPVVAGAIKNREVILTGLMVGITGYAIGNYLGVLVAYILK